MKTIADAAFKTASSTVSISSVFHVLRFFFVPKLLSFYIIKQAYPFNGYLGRERYDDFREHPVAIYLSETGKTLSPIFSLSFKGNKEFSPRPPYRMNITD